MKLQIPQLIALASGAGFSDADLATAVSIALAESGGDPAAYNPERAAGAAQGRGSFGLWQIYATAHPEFSGSNLFDPQINAAAAFAVYRQAGGSFRPWSTFKNGAYLAHVDAVSQAISPPQTDTIAGDDGTPPDTSGSGPDNGGILSIVVIGGLLFWAVTKIFNG